MNPKYVQRGVVVGLRELPARTPVSVAVIKNRTMQLAAASSPCRQRRNLISLLRPDDNFDCTLKIVHTRIQVVFPLRFLSVATHAYQKSNFIHFFNRVII
jgi:hypothetical protein